MHGMMQDWHSEYELLKPLEENYMLIVPAMDGFYDGSPEFTCFADQAKKIEDYVIANHNGRLFGAYGASQGALIPSGNGYAPCMKLSNKQKAALWQLFTGSKSAKNNPYDIQTGRDIIEAMSDGE